MLTQSVYGLSDRKLKCRVFWGAQSFSNFTISQTTIRRPKLPEKLRESRSLKIADETEKPGSLSDPVLWRRYSAKEI
jgi:hypothetical protein